MAVAAGFRKGALTREMQRESSCDVVRCSGVSKHLARPQDDAALDCRYAEMCGPVETKPLVQWYAAPPVKRRGEPTVTIHARGISLNCRALDLLAGDSLAVGIDYRGRLVVAPGSTVRNSPKLYHKPKNFNCYLGGAQLTAWLAEHGFPAGRYRLNVDSGGWLTAEAAAQLPGR